MRFLRSIMSRLRAWKERRARAGSLDLALTLPIGPTIYRDVTPGGVKVYSLCGACGARLECSATLCEECAQGPRTSTF